MFSDEEETDDPPCNHHCCSHCGYKIPYYDNRRKCERSYDCEGDLIYANDLRILTASCCPKDKRLLHSLIDTCLRYNALEALEDLPRFGYQIHPMNNEKQTIIHLAFYKNAHETLNYGHGSILFKYEKDHVNYVDDYGLSHFHIACVTGDIEVVREFLDKSENVNAQFHSDPQGNRKNYTPLHFAAAYDCVAVAELLLLRGADINATDSQGRTPLHLACGDTEMFSRFNRGKFIAEVGMVELLLNCGGDPNATDEQGSTPLFYCFQKFNVDTTEVYSFSDRSIIELKSRQRKIFELLLKRGAVITVVNKDNENILHWIVNDLLYLRSPAVYSNISFKDTPQAELIDYILSTHPELDFNAKSKHGETPLYLAISLMSVEVTKVLLKHNADIKTFNHKKPILLMFPNIPPSLEVIQNVMRMIDFLSEQDCELSLEDNFAIMKFLVHSGTNCDCTLVKSMENIGCVIVNAIYYGSPSHLDYVGKELKESQKSSYLSRCITDKLQEHTYYYLDCKKRLGLFDKKQVILKKLKNMKYDDYQLSKSLDAEVKSMKNTKLKSNISLHNVMTRHYSEIYDHIISENIQELVTGFPRFKNLIKGHVAKSLITHYLQNPARDFLKVLSPTLPDICCKMIILYLSNEDILNMSIAVLPSLSS